MVDEGVDITEVAIRRRETPFLVMAVRASWAILILAIIYQLIFFPDLMNIVAMAAVVLAWGITSRIWLRQEMLEKYLISTFMILGISGSQFYFPLIFTTLENKPLIYNLELPELVFLHSTLALLTLVFAHGFYRFLMRSTPNRSVSLMEKAGFFIPPTHLQLWIMGMFGMAASFYVHFASPEIGTEYTGNSGDKFIQAFVPFLYAPFCIPLGKLFGNTQKSSKGFALMIVAYSVFLFLISMARNSRGAFIFGLTSPAFAYILGLMLGVFKTKILTARNVIVVGFVGWLLTGPFTDLGVAMLIVRGNRTEIPPGELIAQTIETLDDKKAIEARKEDDKSESMDFDWDERYLDNLFTARFSNIKFNDSNLITSLKVGQYDPDMQEYSLDQLIAGLPDPVIKLFGLDVDKEGTLTLSFGDFMYILSGGHGTPQGLRTGQFAATGLATFGWWYLLLFGLVVMPMFYLNDKFFRVRKDIKVTSSTPVENKFMFSFCAVLSITSFFQSLTFESVVQGATYLMRGWIQLAVLYIILFHASRLIGNVLSGRKHRVRLPDLPDHLLHQERIS